MKRCANFGELRGMLIHHDQSIPNLVSSHLFEVQKFPGKCEEIHFMIPPARYVNGTFARQWHTFHHENQLPSLACSHYLGWLTSDPAWLKYIENDVLDRPKPLS